jgi:hypothetical protein
MSKSEAVKWIALGLLVGYLGLYAWDWMKSLKREKASEKPKERQKQTSHV